MYPAIQYGSVTPVPAGIDLVQLLVDTSLATALAPVQILAAPAVGKKWFIHSIQSLFGYARLPATTGQAFIMDFIWSPGAPPVPIVNKALAFNPNDEYANVDISVVLDIEIDTALQYAPNSGPPQTEADYLGIGTLSIVYAEVDA